MPSAIRSDGREAETRRHHEISTTDGGALTLHRVTTNGHFYERQNSIILTGMPTKRDTEIIAAAIAGFEEQKKRLNAQIAELRQMLNPSATEVSALAPKRRRMSAAARARIAAAQRKRWAESSKQTGAASSTGPARKRRKLSAAGRRAIIEATKRRWAALRKAQAR